jgi:hypothetical protein
MRILQKGNNSGNYSFFQPGGEYSGGSDAGDYMKMGMKRDEPYKGRSAGNECGQREPLSFRGYERRCDSGYRCAA